MRCPGVREVMGLIPVVVFFFHVCSIGQQTREVRCVRSDDSTPASANCCGENVKPDSENLCPK